MIGKVKKGGCFGGWVGYVRGKEEGKMVGWDGVLVGRNGEIVESFEVEREVNGRIKKGVGEIGVSLKGEEKGGLRDDLMGKIGVE